MQQKKTEEKLKRIDPKKAEQVERLGMAFGRGSAMGPGSEISHIEQEEPKSSSNRRAAAAAAASDKFFEDEFEFVGFGGSKSGGNKYGDHEDDYGSKSGGSGNNWETEFEVMKSASSGSKSEWNNNFDGGQSQPRRSSAAVSSTTVGEDAQKKFGSAKAISSDMFFDKESGGGCGPDANLSRFAGSSSISSADYFGRTEMRPAAAGAAYNAPDMDDVKESVRQGVTKVAGRLSNMASGVMNQLQVSILFLCRMCRGSWIYR